jgi:8-oxo-dGTP diphosphatase
MVPGPPQRPSERLIVAAGLVWVGADRLLLQRRALDAAFGGGYLELPGGKVERGEDPADALYRELLEEWGPRAGMLEVGPIVDVVQHAYPPPGPEVILLIYEVDATDWGDDWRVHARPLPGHEVEAYDLDDLPLDELLDADRKLVDALVAGEIRRLEQ